MGSPIFIVDEPYKNMLKSWNRKTAIEFHYREGGLGDPQSLSLLLHRSVTIRKSSPISGLSMLLITNSLHLRHVSFRHGRCSLTVLYLPAGNSKLTMQPNRG